MRINRPHGPEASDGSASPKRLGSQDFAARSVGVGDNTFNIESLANNLITRIYGGGGRDDFHVSPLAQNLHNLSGILDLHGEFPGGGTGNASLTVNDQGHTAARNWVFEPGALVAFPSAGSAAGLIQIYFSVFNSVVANGGGGGDTFNVVGTAAGTPVTVNGGGGTDTLDYSTSTTGVTVNLATGEATGLTGGVFNIEDVTGGSGDDFLVGDSGVNVLQGGAGNDILVGGAGNDRLFGDIGRDLLIGGLGADLLDGGAGDDLLIDGTTQFTEPGLNPTALLALMTEWTRTDLDSLGALDSYKARLDHLKNGTGVNGPSYVLKEKGSAASVFDDGWADVLTGGDGYDGFFADKQQDLTDSVGPEK